MCRPAGALPEVRKPKLVNQPGHFSKGKGGHNLRHKPLRATVLR